MEQPNQIATPPAGGRPTEETRILVCQCGSTSFSEKKTTKTAVVFTCAKCGLDTSVKGRVAVVRAPREEVSYALTAKVTAPPPPPEKEDGTPAADPAGGKRPTLGEQGFVQYRFRVAKDADETTIRPALEAVRIMNCKDDDYRAQTWQGLALEYVCASFLAGVDPLVLDVLEAQRQVVQAEAQRVAAKEGRELTARKIARLRASVRDEMAERLGIVPSNKLEPEPMAPAEQASFGDYVAAKDAAAAAEAADDRVPDDGALAIALRDARDDLAQATPGAKPIRIGGATEQAAFQRLAAANGWYLFQVLGDERTRTQQGTRPSLFMVGEDFDGFDPDDRYREDLGAQIENPEMVFVELLPHDYEELPGDQKWEAPDLADTRSIMAAPKTNDDQGGHND
jgi:ribosomal protein L37E